MRLSEEEAKNIGEALAMMNFVVRRLRFRYRIRLAVVLVFVLIGWWNSLAGFSFPAAAAGAALHHGLALAWWWSFRKYYRLARMAGQARGLMESCVWWERIGDGDEAMRQMEEVSRITDKIGNISL